MRAHLESLAGRGGLSVQVPKRTDARGRGRQSFMAIARWARGVVLVLGGLALTARPSAAQNVDDFAPMVEGTIQAIAIESGGSVLLGGLFTSVNGVPRQNLARLTADGQVDPNFNPGTDGIVLSVAVDFGNAIAVGGQFTTLGGAPRQNFGRLFSNGQVQSNFVADVAGVVRTLQASPYGFFVGGTFSSIDGVARQNIAEVDFNGDVTARFSSGTNGSVLTAAFVPHSWTLVIGGQFSAAGGQAREGLAVYDGVSGLLSTTLAPVASAGGTVALLLLSPQGLIVGGAFSSVDGQSRQNLARLLTVGGASFLTLDAGFNPSANATVVTGAVTAGGTIYLGGSFTNLGGAAQSYLGRLSAAGTAQPMTIGPDAGPVRALALQLNGDMIVAGDFSSLSPGLPRGGVARVTSLQLLPALGPMSIVDSGSEIALSWQLGSGLPAPTRLYVDWLDPSTGNSSAGDNGGSAIEEDYLISSALYPTAARSTVSFRVAQASGGRYGGSQSLFRVSSAIPGRELLENAFFTSGLTEWLTYAEPAGSMESSEQGGVFQFRRNGSQAVIFQNTGMPLPTDRGVRATLRVGNTDTVRKRFSVLLHDADFADLQVCTFWLPANAPLATYQVKAFTSKPWTNATVSIYAATQGGSGFYQIDWVQMTALNETGTGAICDDPYAPETSTTSTAPNLLTNGDFASGTLAPWTLFGPIVADVVSQQLLLARPAGTSGGVVLQATGQAVAMNEPLKASLRLGNRSGTRARVTVLVHDLAFADLSACTFWLDPFETRTFDIFTYASRPWANATLSVYPSSSVTTTAFPFSVDNATLSKSVAPGLTGTSCAVRPLV